MGSDYAARAGPASLAREDAGGKVTVRITFTNNGADVVNGGLAGTGHFTARGAITDKGKSAVYRTKKGRLIILRFVTDPSGHEEVQGSTRQRHRARERSVHRQRADRNSVALNLSLGDRSVVTERSPLLTAGRRQLCLLAGLQTESPGRGTGTALDRLSVSYGGGSPLALIAPRRSPV